MTLALWIVLTPLVLWAVFCVLARVYYIYFVGKKNDPNGDVELTTLILFILPFMLAYGWIADKIDKR